MTAWIAVSMSATFVTADASHRRAALRPGWDASAFRRHRAFAGKWRVSAVAVVQTQGTIGSELDAAGTAGRVLRHREGLLGRVQSLVIAAVEASLPAMTRAHLDGADTSLSGTESFTPHLLREPSALWRGRLCIGPLFARLFTVGAARMVQVPVASSPWVLCQRHRQCLYITALGTGRAGSSRGLASSHRP